jgi:hypothetical protein
MTPTQTVTAKSPYPNIDTIVPTLESFDFEAAHREGWTISNRGTFSDGAPRIELHKLEQSPEASPKFREDRDAWAHVVTNARKRSVLHLQALSLVDRRERLAIFAHCGLVEPL